MALVPPLNSPGANLWDKATQGSDYNAAPGQPPLIPGGPEGVIYGSVGKVCVDELGVLYVKASDVSLATGWTTVTAT
jgi:hypothetical protein